MSNIVIVLQETRVDAPVLGALHMILGCSLAQLRTSIKERKPIVEVELFEERQDERARLLRKVIEVVEQHGLAIDVYELLEGDKYESSSDIDQSRISADILQNILRTNDEELQRQLNIEP